MVSEATFKTNLKNRIESEFPGSMIFHLDPCEKSGIPDLVVLYKSKWAALEGKKSKNASRRLHQEYYVNLMDKMAYASFISPENEDQVVDELHKYFD